jgi:hypothetical protein
MPRTTKTSTNAGGHTTKITNPDLDDMLGINEPYINPTLVGAFFRHKGKMYRYNEKEEIERFYPPDEKQPSKKTAATP